MLTTHHLTIGPEFFRNAPRDYSDPSFALVREFFQNGVDAKGCTEIAITLNNNRLSFSNNGEPMSSEVLFGKLLSLGGTTKGDGDVGGFGKAKEILLFCHHSFEIVTGDIKVSGSGATSQAETTPFFHGTRTEIWFNEEVFPSLERAIRRLTAAMSWKGKVTFNDEVLATSFNPRTRRVLAGLGRVKLAKSFSSQLVVRAGGIPMFIKYCEIPDSTVVVDLTGDTKAVLTANRDGLLYGPRSILEAFITQATTSRRELEEQTVECVDYGTELICLSKVEEPVEEAEVEVRSAAFAPAPTRPVVGTPEFEDMVATGQAELIDQHTPAALPVEASGTTTVVTKVASVSVDSKRFTIRNETGMKLDRAFLPETFSANSKRLVRDWAAALTTVYRALNIDAEFATGFVFSDTAEALWESRNGITTYYVNPARIESVVVPSTGSTFRTIRRRKIDRHALLALAVHEVTHGIGFTNHGESFASGMTDVLEKVLRFRK